MPSIGLPVAIAILENSENEPSGSTPRASVADLPMNSSAVLLATSQIISFTNTYLPSVSFIVTLAGMFSTSDSKNNFCCSSTCCASLRSVMSVVVPPTATTHPSPFKTGNLTDRM